MNSSSSHSDGCHRVRCDPVHLDPPMKTLFAIGILAFAFVATASSGPEVKNGRHVRFMAVGEPPPFRQEVRDGIRYELEPPAGSIPPREVVLGFGGDDSAAVPLRLGRISPSLKVPAGTGPLLLNRREAAEGADDDAIQQLMARVTGNFKRGNEKLAKKKNA